ncbi:MAG: electron transport complex subunit RsxD [Halothiobacillaceae bacterium]|nr:electron transport complex subunit RsxD [Halothiobacillaceae bacterium]
MRFKVDTSPFPGSGKSVGGLMWQVCAALVPGTLVALYVMGWGVLFNVLLAVAAGLAAEALMLLLRGRPVRPFLSDGSVVLTGWLLGLCLPALAPWWIPVVGMLFAVVVAKQLYGGLGYNLFNPAMVGYVVLLISFPREMTRWPIPQGELPGFGESLGIVFGAAPQAGWDSVTGATPLDALRTVLSHEGVVQTALQGPAFGWLGGQGSEWVVLAFLAGGLWLLWRGVIRWHIPVAVLTSLLLVSGLFWLIDPAHHASPLLHLFAGAAVFGAFFIATDPVTASTTVLGRLVFGAGIGLLIYLIRAFGGYPDGVAFAVLLMNLAVPLIDYYTRPRVFGHGRD